MHFCKLMCLTKTVIFQFVGFPDTVCESKAGNSYSFCQSCDKGKMLTSILIVIRLLEAPQNFQHWVKLQGLVAWV